MSKTYSVLARSGKAIRYRRARRRMIRRVASWSVFGAITGGANVYTATVYVGSRWVFVVAAVSTAAMSFHNAKGARDEYWTQVAEILGTGAVNVAVNVASITARIGANTETATAALTRAIGTITALQGATAANLSETPPRVIGGMDGPVVGWRAWHVQKRAGCYWLASPYQKAVWHLVNVASCHTHRHRAPHDGCWCGFYAMKDPAWCSGDVMGLVIGWGEIVEHASGWRSEHAQVIALLSESPSEHTAAIAEHYGVPLVTVDQARAMASEWDTTADVRG